MNIERKDRLEMTGFLANVKIDGIYNTFPLVDINEEGIGIHVPVQLPVKEGDQFEIRYDIIDEKYGSFDTKVNYLIKKEGVAGTGIVRRILPINNKLKLVGLKMDYIADEAKEAKEKVKKAREIIKKLNDFPKSYIEFGFQVEEQARDPRLRGYPTFEGVIATEDHMLKFLVDAEYEYLFLDNDYVSIKLPIKGPNGDFFVIQGHVKENHIFNMYKNLISVELDVWDKNDQELLKRELTRHNIESEDILRFPR
ncbi:MAG TPA: hypothetical protein P5077_12420 [bacterium]|nr:hypothetical protein [bacterium]